MSKGTSQRPPSLGARTSCLGWLFVSPWLIGFVAFIAYPFAASLYWSFCRFDLLSSPEWIGLSNYERIARETAEGIGFGRALWNTGYYALLSVPLSIALGIALAVMLSWRIRGQAVYRSVFFLPSVVPVVASSVLWLWLLDPQDGIVNWATGLTAQHAMWFQGEAELANVSSWFEAGQAPRRWEVVGPRVGSKDALILMSLWGVGNFMIIYLAAIGDIPVELYEAAQLDGAGPGRRFWSITLPMLSPVIFFNLVMGLIHSVQAFTQVYIVSAGTGEPGQSTLVLSLHLFLSAFRDLDMGYASAMAWIMFVVLLLCTVAIFRSSRFWVFYRGARL